MKFIAGVHNAIAQCPSSLALVSSKVYQSFAPLTATMPYLIVGALSDEAVSPALDGNVDTLRKANIPIMCVSSTVSSSATIADTLRVELYNARGTLATGTTVLNIHVLDTNYQWDPGEDGTENGAHICIINLNFFYRATTPAPVTFVAGP